MQYRGYNVLRAAELVLRSFLGQLTEEEQEEYARMKQETDLQKHSVWLNDFQKMLAKLKNPSRFDTGEAYRLFLSHTSRTPRRVRLRNLKIAASFIIPLMLTGIIYYTMNRGNEPSGRIEQVGYRASVILADGSRINLEKHTGNISRENGTVLINDSGRLIYNTKSRSKVLERDIYNELVVPRGGEYMLLLADGTQVWLNSDTRLRFPVQFSGAKRDVYLSGEAYFAVKHDTIHPFIVHTSLGNINVLGTEFNVRDYQDESRVVTTLVNGCVKYEDKKCSDRFIVLKPGFQVKDCSGGNELNMDPVNLPEYIGWKDGLYIFRNLTLEQIMKMVERNYDMTVFYANEAMKRLKFSGDLKKYECVENFLQYIETGGDVVFTVKGRTITVSPK